MTLTFSELKSIQDALVEGVLLDVTDVAESLALHAHVSISVGYWSTPPISRTEDGLIAAMTLMVTLFEHGDSQEAESFDGKTVWTYPQGFKDGNQLANVFRVWRDEQRRLHVIVLARGESLEFRVTRSAKGGSLYTQ